MFQRLALTAAVLVFAAGIFGCGSGASAGHRPVVLATTTSVNDSGLLEMLVPDFERVSGYGVKTIAVGTGKALAMGERGEADVLLVHAPASEREMLSRGAVSERWVVMHNYFALAGPPEDPADIRGMKSAVDAVRRISGTHSTVISRGDDSGTHKMEQSLWSSVGQVPSGSWYLESGQGMGATLVIASEKQAYTLTDLGTYLAFKRQLRLEVLVPESPSLINVYSVLVVNPGRFPQANADGARAFARYLLSERAQELIREFGVARFGAPLFIPDAGNPAMEMAG